MTSLGELLEGDPDDVVAYLHDVPTTRAQMHTLVDEIAARLRAAHLERRVVGVLAPNAPAAIAAWFAVWSVGGVFAPLNPRVPAEERERLVDATGAAAVLETSPPVLRMIAPDEPRAVDPREAIIQFTSGTTGRPKAVPLRHDTVIELLDGVLASLRGANPADRARMPNLVPVSLSLWAGIYQVLFAFRLGVPVILMERFEPVEFARLVRAHGIRSSVLPPAAMVMLLQEPRVTTLEPLRYVRSVSAPLSPAHARRFHERFGVAILNGYGQTELGGEVVGWTSADWKEFGEAKLGAAGRPHDGIDVRVRDGELQVRRRVAPAAGGSAADSTALGDRLTEDGWVRTGDLGRIDDDGFVWIEGRVSSMINRGGLKVFPDEVEEQLREHPSVADAAVAALPDERLGEVPWAFVVPAPGAVVDGEELRAWCRERMAPYKVPAGATVVDALPRNEIGKLLRHDLVPLAAADRPG